MVWTELAFWLIDMSMVLWLVNQPDAIILMQISGEAGRENECSSYHAGQKSDVHEESYQSAVLETETPLGYATDRSMVMFLSLQDRKSAALSAKIFGGGWQERQLEAKFARREPVAVIVSL